MFRFRFDFDFFPSKRCIMKSKRWKIRSIITNETLVDIAAATAAASWALLLASWLSKGDARLLYL